MNWNHYRNFKEAFDDAEKIYGEHVVLKYLNKREVVEITSTEFYKRMRHIASGISGLGLAGKHVGLIGENRYEYFVYVCALLYAGCVTVLFSKDFSADEIRQYAEFTDTKTIIYSSEMEEKCVLLKGELQMIDMDTEYEHADTEVVNDAKLEDLVNIIFTSGTTGTAKAVMHSNRSLLSGVVNPYMGECFGSYLVVFPFHHIGGYLVALNAFFQGATICLGDNPGRILKYLDKLKPEYLFVVPALMEMICQKLRKQTQEELGWNIKAMGSGGAKSIAGSVKLVLESGIKLFQSYSASELAGRGVSCFVDINNLDCLGKPGVLAEARLDDGELVIESPSVFMGYYNNPEETEKSLKGNAFYTGDLAKIDKDGYYYLTGRKKNLIILSNGENVSPEEIEKILYQNVEMREVLVYEEQDRIAAKIYPAYGEDDSEDQKAALKEKVRELVEEYNDQALTYKQIQIVHVTDEPLPKTASNKILRVAVSERISEKSC